MRQEPQIGIEPMTARRDATADDIAPTESESTARPNGAQDIPEDRPFGARSGNEMATEVGVNIASLARLAVSAAAHRLPRFGGRIDYPIYGPDFVPVADRAGVRGEP